MFRVVWFEGGDGSEGVWFVGVVYGVILRDWEI